MIIFKCEKGAEKYTYKIIEKLINPDFFVDAGKIKNFAPEYTNPDSVTGMDILTPLILQNEIVTLGFYTQNWWAHKAFPVNAYVDSTGRNMFLNRRQQWRGDDAFEETIWHELTHVSDSINKHSLYWHGENKLKGKDETAPVKFAKWAASWGRV